MLQGGHKMSEKMIRINLFGESQRVKIYPSGGSIANGILNIFILLQEEEEPLAITIRGTDNYHTYMTLLRIQAASCIEIRWLQQEQEGCYFISLQEEIQDKPCTIKIVS